MTDEEQIKDAVDEIVDEVETPVEKWAKALGLDEAEIADRVANEIKARFA